MMGFPKKASDFPNFKDVFNPHLKDCLEKQIEFYLNNQSFFSSKTEDWKYFPFQKWIDREWNFNPPRATVETKKISSFLPSSLPLVLQKGRPLSPLKKSTLFFCSWKDFLSGKVQLDLEKTKKILSALEKKRNPFCALNNIYGEGFILIVKGSLDQPLEIHYMPEEGPDLPSSNLRSFIFVEKQARAQILEVFHGRADQQALFLNAQTDCFLSEKAFLEHSSLDQTKSEDILINQSFAELAPLSKAGFFSVSLNAGISRRHVELQQEEQSQSELRGLSLLEGKRYVNHKVSVRHFGREGFSRQLYKSFLFDSAKQVFQGLVSIERLAQKSDSGQLSKNFLFGKRAFAVAFPELDISADDVQAQHGATVSSFQENKDQFFYLQSRGIEPLSAFYLVLSGLIEDSLSCLQPNIRHFFKLLIQKKLKSLEPSLYDLFL